MVFYISIFFVLLFVLWGAFFSQNRAAVAHALLAITIEKFGWFYLIVVFFLFIFSLYLAFSRYGQIVLGADEPGLKSSEPG